MGEPFIGEIRLFGGSFAPAGWAFCDGQLIPISENDALFALIGTTYGGDGNTTFGLPDLRGRIPLHAGQGPGVTQNYQLGENAGVETVTLTTQQTPTHNHTLLASNEFGQNPQPQDSFFAQLSAGSLYIGPADPLVNLNASVASPVGGNQPHENMMPYLAISFIISLFGVFPQQS